MDLDATQEMVVSTTHSVERHAGLHFSDLAAELRNLIYHDALPPARIEVDKSEIGEPPLTRSSRQLRAETLPLYYGLNTFVLICHSTCSPKQQISVNKWLERDDNPSITHLREIECALLASPTDALPGIRQSRFDVRPFGLRLKISRDRSNLHLEVRSVQLSALTHVLLLDCVFRARLSLPIELAKWNGKDMVRIAKLVREASQRMQYIKQEPLPEARERWVEIARVRR